MPNGSASDLCWILVPHMRGQGNALPSLHRSPVLEGADGRSGTSGRPRTGRGTRSIAAGDQGVWPRLLAYMQADPDRSASLVVRAHVSASGASNRREADPALGRSRGGFSTRGHSLTDRRGRSLGLSVMGGPRYDHTLGKDGTDASLSCLIADRAWDGNAFRAWLVLKGIKAVIPARHRRTFPHDPARYKARHAVARGLGWLKG